MSDAAHVAKMATFVAFDMNASASDRLNALFKAAPKPSVHISAPHLPHLPTPNLSPVMSVKSNAPSITVKEIPAGSGWSNSAAGSTRPGSIMEGKTGSGRKGLRNIFSRNKMADGKPEIIEEERESSGAIAPMPSVKDLHRALELTAKELGAKEWQEDVEKSPMVTTPISMNPFMTYIDTPPTETEAQSISDSLEKNIAAASASESGNSDSLNIQSIISKAKRMSITSIQGARPSTATSTMSSPSTPREITQAPPTKKRSSIFPQRGSRPGSNTSSAPATDTIIDGQPFVKALKEAKKHSTLSTPKLSSDAIITMSQWKEGEVLALGSSKSEKARLKLKKQIADMINKAGWTNKIYVLTAGGLTSPPYILQFAPAGLASRQAERALQLTKQSRAFVTDAIPGKHWVLQVSQLLDTIAATDVKKPVSRISFRPSEKVQKLVHLLLILNSGDDMEEWLTALRHEIDVLGGKGRHVDAVAEVPTEIVEIALEQDVKPNYPASVVSETSNATRLDQPTSESDRGSWSGASQRQSTCYSYRPSVDAASSTISSAEARKLESLRHSGHSRMTTDNIPPTPSSSTHSPNPSFSSSPGALAPKNIFYNSDTPSETEEDKAARVGYDHKVTCQPPNIPIDPVSSRAASKARRSFQIVPPSPLAAEITPSGTASQEMMKDVAPQRKRSLRGPPPTAFGHGAHLSVAQDHPSPASFQNSPAPENDFHLYHVEREEDDYFPTQGESVPEIPNIPIPPRSNRRQSLQTPLKLDLVPEIPALYVPSPEVSPVQSKPLVFEKHMSRVGSGGSEVKIQFWGPLQPPNQTTSVSHSRTASEEERDIERMDELTAMVQPRSIQEQMRTLKEKQNRSSASLGRSDPFNLEAHLAAVSLNLVPSDSDTNRYSYLTEESVYSENSFGAGAEFADEERDRSAQPSPSMVPLPLLPLALPDLTSPIGRANAKALSLRAERAAKRDSWGRAPLRPDSIHKTSFRRGSRTGPAFGVLSPPKPLSARGFINLAATPTEEVKNAMESPQGMTRLKRSTSDGAQNAPREYPRPANYRSSTAPTIPLHTGAMMATPAQMAGKNTLPRRSPVLSSTADHLAQCTTASLRNMVPAMGPMLPPPHGALPSVPEVMAARVGSVHSHRSQRPGETQRSAGMESVASVRYEDDTRRRW